MLQPSSHVLDLTIRIKSEPISDAATSHFWFLARREDRKLAVHLLLTTAEWAGLTQPTSSELADSILRCTEQSCTGPGEDQGVLGMT